LFSCIEFNTRFFSGFPSEPSVLALSERFAAKPVKIFITEMEYCAWKCYKAPPSGGAFQQRACELNEMYPFFKFIIQRNQAADHMGTDKTVAPGNRLVALSKVFGKYRFFRWLVYGAAIGALSALMAAVVFFLLEWTTFFGLEYLAGYPVTKPAGEHLVHFGAGTSLRLWLLVLLPAIGGLLSGIIVYTWAPEAEGHGTDAFIDAFHNKQGVVRTRVPFVKGLASIITLATGGSAGREGPIAQIGAGIGSWFGRILKLNIRERRLLLLAGSAGGLGAIFRAPLGGALTAVEVLYREDFETEGVVLCIISSSASYAIFTGIFGHQPIFAIPTIKFSSALELILYAILGLVCVPFGYIYVKTFYGLRDRFFRKLPIKRALIPALGGILVGLIALWQPCVLSGGYGTIQKALTGELPVALMFSLAFLKIAATSFTISSGGSGASLGRLFS